jgi:hypothetical protein
MLNIKQLWARVKDVGILTEGVENLHVSTIAFLTTEPECGEESSQRRGQPDDLWCRQAQALVDVMDASFS